MLTESILNAATVLQRYLEHKVGPETRFEAQTETYFQYIRRQDKNYHKVLVIKDEENSTSLGIYFGDSINSKGVEEIERVTEELGIKRKSSISGCSLEVDIGVAGLQEKLVSLLPPRDENQKAFQPYLRVNQDESLLSGLLLIRDQEYIRDRKSVAINDLEEFVRNSKSSASSKLIQKLSKVAEQLGLEAMYPKTQGETEEVELDICLKEFVARAKDFTPDELKQKLAKVAEELELEIRFSKPRTGAKEFALTV